MRFDSTVPVLRGSERMFYGQVEFEQVRRNAANGGCTRP